MFKIGPFIIIRERELEPAVEDRYASLADAVRRGMEQGTAEFVVDIAKLRMEIAALRSELPTGAKEA